MSLLLFDISSADFIEKKTGEQKNNEECCGEAKLEVILIEKVSHKIVVKEMFLP